MSRALGDHFMKENGLGLISEPYVCQPIELTDEDCLLIVASDGVRCPAAHPLFHPHLFYNYYLFSLYPFIVVVIYYLLFIIIVAVLMKCWLFGACV